MVGHGDNVRIMPRRGTKTPENGAEQVAHQAVGDNGAGGGAQPPNRGVCHIRAETIANDFPVVDDVSQIIACACDLQARFHHDLTRRMAISRDADEGPHQGYMAVAGGAGIRGHHPLRHPGVAGTAGDVTDDERRNLGVRDEVTQPLKRLQQEH
jgi:hypothetical protein